MDLFLKGKRVLVTGSTSGIGKAIAKLLASEGCTVLINGRTEEKVQQTMQEIRASHPQASLEPAVADLSSATGSDKITGKYPEIDILINNMGIFEPADFFETADEQWQKMFETNIMSGIRLSRHYLKGMLERNEGKILFISSEAAIMPSPEMAHYSATKTMQLSISRSLAELTRGTKVTVNTVMPGSTLTEGVEEHIKKLYKGESMTLEEAERRFMSEHRPSSLIQRLIRPEEIASFVAFLCSPRSSAINGASLRIDGGLVHTIF
ncbi:MULTISPECIES: SDR family NAD(P)-dependent oxidoreductase [Thermoactinomyces]|jgi:3-oxoacyl-[acyl-carrier protein] reductase|uniref:SDR family oxidoreductase n=1 Tax=Thermoactinomyces daqus TaxID=1329516 RepID=A0A7W1XAX5_9BACL|nr:MULTISPECIES: SDR family oxidoreductase [Thermoactinomyces]MBA4543276.1 SDR family oxidoreductase [Thermoactinomyces daqus]MBH8599570.1 SDR family oxidoreductase [Thermoactinomyces sp. CICC 10523]MBH8605703.1 SDR family oxidoreductase [Thermoactinomyces sp. CICC 10522]